MVDKRLQVCGRLSLEDFSEHHPDLHNHNYNIGILSCAIKKYKCNAKYYLSIGTLILSLPLPLVQ